jgi:hypothetical protein
MLSYYRSRNQCYRLGKIRKGEGYPEGEVLGKLEQTNLGSLIRRGVLWAALQLNKPGISGNSANSIFLYY